MTLRPFVSRAIPPLSPYTTDPATLIKLAEASSYQYNSRNLENSYYAVHHHVLANVANFDNLTTHTNPMLDVQWREAGAKIFDKAPHIAKQSKAHDTAKAKSSDPLLNAKVMYGRDDGSDNEGSTDDEAKPGALAWETASARSDETTPAQRNYLEEGSPDVMVTHIRLSAMSVPTRIPNLPDAAIKVYEYNAFKFRIHGGVKIHHSCPALIGEIKPSPSRKEDIPPWITPWNIRLAIADLFFYAKMVFTIHPYLTEIACYAAAGMYWTWRVVQREELEVDAAEYDWGRHDWVDGDAAKRETMSFRKKFPRFQQIGTEESDEKYSIMRRDYFYHLANDWQPKQIPTVAP